MTKTYEPLKDEKLEKARLKLKEQIDRLKAQGIKFNYHYNEPKSNG